MQGRCKPCRMTDITCQHSPSTRQRLQQGTRCSRGSQCCCTWLEKAEVELKEMQLLGAIDTHSM